MSVNDKQDLLLNAGFALDDPDALRDLAACDGYVYLPGLISAQRMRAATDAMLSVAARHGLLPGGNGAATPGRLLVEGQSDAWFDLYADLLRQQALYAVAWEPRLIAVMQTILGPHAIPHPCAIFRIVGPGVEAYAKPAHQDMRYVGGHAAIWTAWIACGECDGSVGGVEILAGSHRYGELPVRPVDWGKEAVGPPDLKWRKAPMLPGDALLFSSYTVHRTIPNVSTEGLRMSVDFRYQSSTEAFRPDALLPHAGILSWEDIYQEWDDAEELRYYWRRHELSFHAR
ncbi:MAG: phytanoyl-CoA dioxygenase family protein [Actinomycetota bacterium]|nr:phytanoyl-CoA dioxygenase family protein [Actinomycetota bacterium]